MDHSSNMHGKSLKKSVTIPGDLVTDPKRKVIGTVLYEIWGHNEKLKIKQAEGRRTLWVFWPGEGVVSMPHRDADRLHFFWRSWTSMAEPRGLMNILYLLAAIDRNDPKVLAKVVEQVKIQCGQKQGKAKSIEKILYKSQKRKK